MSAKTYRSGAIKCFKPSAVPTVTPSSLVSLAFTASAASYVAADNNDRRSDLDTTATYQVILAPMMLDPTNKGYSIMQSSSGSGIISVAAGEGIQLTVSPGAWPANYSYVAGIQVWLKKNAGQFKLHSIYPPDTSNTWSVMIITDTNPEAISKDVTFLMSTTVDADYPKRTALIGVQFTSVGDTTGGIDVEDTAEQVQYSPDLSTDYALASARGMKFTFSTLNDGMSDIVSSTAGEYVKFTSGSNTYETSLRAYQSADVFNSGNMPWKFIYPIDNHKAVEELYLYASTKQNQTPGSYKFGKQEPPTISYVVDTINSDSTLIGLHCVSSRILYAT